MIANTPIILASASVSRRDVLTAAGISFEIVPSSVDENALKEQFDGNDYAKLALILASAKANAVSEKYPNHLVLGCDQLLVLDREVFDKPKDLANAKHHLEKLSGRTHRLLSAAVLIESGKTRWQTVETASLTMRDLSDSYIKSYLDQEGEAVLTSVGAYLLEGCGAQLFSAIEGDHFTIRGLPLLPLMAALRSLGFLQT